MRKAFIFILLIIQQLAIGQAATLLESTVVDYRPVYFDRESNRYYGCGISIHCQGLPLIIQSFSYSKDDKLFNLKGYISPITDKFDTIGTNVYRIFLAVPTEGTLVHIRPLVVVNDTIQTLSKSCQANLKTGYFDISFTVLGKERLYIEGTSRERLMEFDLARSSLR